MPGLQQHTHTHNHPTDYEYADPVLRPPSPASSVGTAYAPDQTSHSDSEFQLSRPAFERKVRDTTALDRPRPEEVDADRDPLIMVDCYESESEGTHGRPVSGSVWVGSGRRSLEPEEEKRLYAQTMHNLRLEVAKLREDEIFDQILLRGSSAALEVQPSTDDIDALMRGMMGMGTGTGTGLALAAVVNGHGHGAGAGGRGRGQPHIGTSKTAPPPNLPAAANVNGPGITNGPWNNFGQQPESEAGTGTGTGTERRDPSMDGMLSGTSATTVGKRSARKGSRKVL